MRPAPLPPPSIPLFARGAALVGAAAGIAFLLVLASLHALRPDLNPTWRVISEYALGPHGGIMQAAFLALALATATVGVAAYAQVRTLGGYLGLVLLLVTTVGMVLMGLYETDPLTTPADASTPTHRVHILGAMLDFLPLAAPLISYSITRSRRTDFTGRWLRYLAWLPLLGTIVFFGSIALLLPANGGAFGPDVLIGIPNRVMIVTHSVWLILAAGYLLRLPTAAHAPTAAA